MSVNIASLHFMNRENAQIKSMFLVRWTGWKDQQLDSMEQAIFFNNVSEITRKSVKNEENQPFPSNISR
jgi:hypothetical protein